LQLTFPHDPLAPFVHAFYPIFKLTTALGQLFCDFVGAAGGIATDRGDELYELADVKFVGWHGGDPNVRQIECITEKRCQATDLQSGEGVESESPDRKIGSARRACLELTYWGDFRRATWRSRCNLHHGPKCLTTASAMA
jgi:hypothetical protein